MRTFHSPMDSACVFSSQRSRGLTVSRMSIDEVRRLLKDGVERFEDPFEPMIPTEHWEMLK